MIEGVITALIDQFPKVLLKRRKVFVAGMSLLFLLLGLPTVTQVRLEVIGSW